MEINIDFLVSGCNTRCRHCYVAGGPGPLMKTEDALLCIEKLDELAERLTGKLSFTLDHEPMNHPQVEQIIRAAAGTKHIQNFHHGMTTGIGLMHRKDRDAVLKTYRSCGYSSFGLTIHGSAEHHDEIVRQKGAYAAALEAAGYFKTQGVRLEISLMVNRFFPEDAESITELIERVQPDYTGCVIPIYTPHSGMNDFEPYRASLADLEDLSGYLTYWGQDEGKYLENARKLTVSSAVTRLREGPDLRDLFSEPQDELYLTLHQDCMLYAGNSGAETLFIGDIRKMDPEQAAEMIRGLPGNRDYGAFYDVRELPSAESLIRALENLSQDLLYGDFESAVYRGLAALEVPTRIFLPGIWT